MCGGVDIVLTFPPDATESTVLWFKSRIETIEAGIILQVKSTNVMKGMTRTQCFAFYICATDQVYLKGLDRMNIAKPVKQELGGGKKEFSLKEVSLYPLNT